MRFITTISDSIINGSKRLVKAYFTRRNVINVRQFLPFGIDSSPIKGLTGVYCDTSLKGKGVILGYVGPSNQAEPGEIRIYSTDSSGTVKAEVHIKANGVIEVSGESIELFGDSDNAVRYSNLETAFNQLKSDFNDLVTSYNTHTHTGVTSGASSTGITIETGTPSTADITGAKIDEIKTP